MSLINYKIELKLKWTRFCVFPEASNENYINDISNPNNTIFIIKDKKLQVPVATLSGRENKKLSKLFSKGFERSVYWNEYKTKSDNINTTNEFKYFLESNFVSVNRLFVLVYSNNNDNAKKCKGERYYLPKGILDNYIVIIIEKNFYIYNLFLY